jgi:AcrR family transcriptional regulator
VSSAATPHPRQRLLDAAADLFYRQGITAVGVDLISHAAGVSKRTLYQQFGSKDQLVAACLDAHGPEIIGIYVPADDDGSPPRAKILAAFEAMRAWSASDGFRGCPFVNTATELADPGHPARTVAREYKLRLRDYFARQARLGGAIDPVCLADQLMMIFDGAIAQVIMGVPGHPQAALKAVEALLAAQDFDA